MEFMGTAGENRQGIGDGAPDVVRTGKTGELVVGQAHASFYEQTSRSVAFTVGTAVAGVAPGTALSTTPPLAIWNPPGSGVYLAINRVAVGYVSGTLGAGHLVYAQVAQSTVPTSGTELVPVCTMVGNFLRSPIRAFQGSTVSATPTIIRSSGLNLAAFAGAADSLKPPSQDRVDGEIVLAPGNCFVVQGNTAAGTSPLVTLSAYFEVVNIT